VFFEKVKSLWHNIKHEDAVEEFTWTCTEGIDPFSDVYIEIITAQKLKVGFIPTTEVPIDNQEKIEMQFNELHWITIDDHSIDHLDLISKFLLFIMGMVCIPSQMGWFMTDWADLKVALQYGKRAIYISLSEHNVQSWSDSKTLLSSIMLLNEDLPMNKKLEIAADLIPRSHLNKDYLAILNITNSNYLPHSNMLLLVYKN